MMLILVCKKLSTISINKDNYSE